MMNKPLSSWRLTTLIKYCCIFIVAIIIFNMGGAINTLFFTRNNLYAKTNGNKLGNKIGLLLQSHGTDKIMHNIENEEHIKALRYFSVYEKRQKRILKSTNTLYENDIDNTKGNRNEKKQNKKIVPYSFTYDLNAEQKINLMVLDNFHLESKASKFEVRSNTIEPAIDTLSKLLSHSTSSSVFEIIPKSGSVILLGEVSVLAAVWGHPTFVLNVWDETARKMYGMDIKNNNIADSLKIFPTRINVGNSKMNGNNNNNHNLLADLELALDDDSKNNINSDFNVDTNEVFDPEYMPKQLEEKQDVFLLHLSLCGVKSPTVNDFHSMSNSFRSLFFRGQLPFVLVSICRGTMIGSSGVGGTKSNAETSLLHDRIGDLFNTLSRSNYTAHTLIDLKYLNDYSLVTFVEQIFKDRVQKPKRNGNGYNSEQMIGTIGTQTLLFVHGSAHLDFKKWLNPPNFFVPRVGKDAHKILSRSVFEEKVKNSNDDVKMVNAVHATS
jgi:hypothetical protein